MNLAKHFLKLGSCQMHACLCIVISVNLFKYTQHVILDNGNIKVNILKLTERQTWLYPNSNSVAYVFFYFCHLNLRLLSFFFWLETTKIKIIILYVINFEIVSFFFWTYMLINVEKYNDKIFLSYSFLCMYCLLYTHE
jgi:hypothetical protein